MGRVTVRLPDTQLEEINKGIPYDFFSLNEFARTAIENLTERYDFDALIKKKFSKMKY